MNKKTCASFIFFICGVVSLTFSAILFSRPCPFRQQVQSAPPCLTVVTNDNQALIAAIEHVADEIHNLRGCVGDVSNMMSKVDSFIDRADSMLISSSKAIEPIPILSAQVSNLVSEASTIAASLSDDASMLLLGVNGAFGIVANSVSNTLQSADSSIISMESSMRASLSELDDAVRHLSDILKSIRDDPHRFINGNIQEIEQ